MPGRVGHRAEDSRNINRMLAIEGDHHIKFSNQQEVSSNSRAEVAQDRRSLYHSKALVRR